MCHARPTLVAAHHVTATYTNAPVEEVLTSLAATLVHVDRNGRTVTLSPVTPAAGRHEPVCAVSRDLDTQSSWPGMAMLGVSRPDRSLHKTPAFFVNRPPRRPPKNPLAPHQRSSK